MDLTPKEAANLLNVSEETVYGWIRNGTLHCYRVRDKYRLNRVELLEWATARRMNISPEIFRNGVQAATLLLTNALRRGGIVYGLACNDKRSALKAVCFVLNLPESVNRDELFNVLVAREALCSTGIGGGVAIPHPRGPIMLGISEPSVTLAFLQTPIEYGAIDGQPVSVLFLIVSTTVRVHLLLLSHLMYGLQDPDFRRLLETRAAQDQILAKLEEIEARVAEKDGGQGDGS